MRPTLSSLPSPPLPLLILNEFVSRTATSCTTRHEGKSGIPKMRGKGMDLGRCRSSRAQRSIGIDSRDRFDDRGKGESRCSSRMAPDLGFASPRGVRDSLELGLTFRRFISRIGLGVLRHLSARLSESRKDMQAVERRIPFGSIVVSEHPRIVQTDALRFSARRRIRLPYPFPWISTFILI